MHMKFFVDGTLVSAKGMRADPQLIADLFIKKPLRQQGQDFMLARRQFFQVGRRRFDPECLQRSHSCSTFRRVSDFLKLDLDINTPIEFQGEIDQDQTANVFARLVECANEICENGDVA